MKTITQYLGKVSITCNNKWSKDRTYDRLCLVYTDFASYVSKKAVPVNINIEDEEYWQPVANLREDIKNDFEEFEKDIIETLDGYRKKLIQSRIVVNDDYERDALTYEQVAVGCEVYVLSTKKSWICESIVCGANTKTWRLDTRNYALPDKIVTNIASGNTTKTDKRYDIYGVEKDECELFAEEKAIGNFYINSATPDTAGLMSADDKKNFDIIVNNIFDENGNYIDNIEVFDFTKDLKSFNAGSTVTQEIINKLIRCENKEALAVVTNVGIEPEVVAAVYGGTTNISIQIRCVGNDGQGRFRLKKYQCSINASTRTITGVVGNGDYLDFEINGDGTKFLSNNGSYKTITSGGSGESNVYILALRLESSLTEEEYNDLADAIDNNKIILLSEPSGNTKDIAVATLANKYVNKIELIFYLGEVFYNITIRPDENYNIEINTYFNYYVLDVTNLYKEDNAQFSLDKLAITNLVTSIDNDTPIIIKYKTLTDKQQIGYSALAIKSSSTGLCGVFDYIDVVESKLTYVKKQMMITSQFDSSAENVTVISNVENNTSNNNLILKAFFFFFIFL